MKRHRSGSGDYDRKRRHYDDHHHSESRSYGTDESAEDDEVGHLNVFPGDWIGERYEVLYIPGKGTFGKVLLCEDHRARRKVAIKVVRRIRKYTEAARIEADILAQVNRADPSGASLCVRYYTSFEHDGHFCMVFEPLGPSLYDYVKANGYKPPPLYCIQAFADQLITSIAFLHEMRLVHTDLKLENVLLASRGEFIRTDKPNSTRKPGRILAPDKTEIRLIDFGGATFDYDYKSSLINTRQYRAPEVILGLGWSTPSDMWSVGCILMELYVGELLFQTHDNAEHLALIEAILGPFPVTMVSSGGSGTAGGGGAKITPEIREFFDRTGRQRFPANAVSKDSVRHVRSAKRLEALIHPRDTVFLDLVRGLLRHDPDARMTAREALNHRFFTAVRGHKDPVRPAVMPSGSSSGGGNSSATAAGRMAASSGYNQQPVTPGAGGAAMMPVRQSSLHQQQQQILQQQAAAMMHHQQLQQQQQQLPRRSSAAAAFGMTSPSLVGATSGLTVPTMGQVLMTSHQRQQHQHQQPVAYNPRTHQSREAYNPAHPGSVTSGRGGGGGAAAADAYDRSAARSSRLMASPAAEDGYAPSEGSSRDERRDGQATNRRRDDSSGGLIQTLKGSSFQYQQQQQERSYRGDRAAAAGGGGRRYASRSRERSGSPLRSVSPSGERVTRPGYHYNQRSTGQSDDAPDEDDNDDDDVVIVSGGGRNSGRTGPVRSQQQQHQQQSRNAQTANEAISKAARWEMADGVGSRGGGVNNQNNSSSSNASSGSARQQQPSWDARDGAAVLYDAPVRGPTNQQQGAAGDVHVSARHSRGGEYFPGLGPLPTSSSSSSSASLASGSNHSSLHRLGTAQHLQPQPLAASTTKTIGGRSVGVVAQRLGMPTNVTSSSLSTSANMAFVGLRPQSSYGGSSMASGSSGRAPASTATTPVSYGGSSLNKLAAPSAYPASPPQAAPAAGRSGGAAGASAVNSLQRLTSPGQQQAAASYR